MGWPEIEDVARIEAFVDTVVAVDFTGLVFRSGRGGGVGVTGDGIEGDIGLCPTAGRRRRGIWSYVKVVKGGCCITR